MNPSHRPVFSIVTFVHRPITEHLHMSIDSVSSQTFADWEWNLVEDTLAGHTVSSILSTAENTRSANSRAATIWYRGHCRCLESRAGTVWWRLDYPS